MKAKRILSPLPVPLALLAIGLAEPLPAVVLGLVDDFQDGTTQGWQIGANADPLSGESRFSRRHDLGHDWIRQHFRHPGTVDDDALGIRSDAAFPPACPQRSPPSLAHAARKKETGNRTVPGYELMPSESL